MKTQEEMSPGTNHHIFDAKVIRTDKGSGLMVESGIIGGEGCFILRHLGTAACIPVGLDGAKALKVLLDEWIETHDGFRNGTFSLAK